MGWKYWLAVSLSIVFFICIIILGTNVSAARFAHVVGQEIPPPFSVQPLDGDIIELDILGQEKSLSLAPLRNVKSSIQNTLVTVKFNLAPRAEFIQTQWQQGINQFSSDIEEIMNYFH
ncbi:MAG: hypothetical protein ACOYVD_18165 [Bacillota bacterium]